MISYVLDLGVSKQILILSNTNEVVVNSYWMICKFQMGTWWCGWHSGVSCESEETSGHRAGRHSGKSGEAGWEATSGWRHTRGHAWDATSGSLNKREYNLTLISLPKHDFYIKCLVKCKMLSITYKVTLQKVEAFLGR